MIALERVSDKPILKPEPAHPWEVSAVFNYAAVYNNGLVHMYCGDDTVIGVADLNKREITFE